MPGIFDNKKIQVGFDARAQYPTVYACMPRKPQSL